MNSLFQPTTSPDVKPFASFCRAKRRVSLLIGIVMFGIGTDRIKSAEITGSKEHELKAAFIYNFTKFIEWPANSFADPNAPFVIAFTGNVRGTAELQQIARERKVQGRVLLIKTIKAAEEARGAQVLYLAAADLPRAKDWLDAVRGAGVLTIGNSESFLDDGGMISFMIEGEKIRFGINMDPADAAGLKVSAQLQKLAKTVRRKQ